MCLLHKWNKWRQYDVAVPPVMLSGNWRLSGATDHMQARTCKKCGKKKIKKVGRTVF